MRPETRTAEGCTAVPRVLIIEDNPVNLEFVVAVLESGGYRLLTATTAEAGLHAARTERPDVILLDIHLPRISGYEVAQRLKADPATAPIPIVAITAQAMRGEEVRAQAAGCNAFLTKPVEPDLLRRTLRQLLAGC
jgi:CheY-like chemotaxis protein